jgi:hypothetical protein
MSSFYIDGRLAPFALTPLTGGPLLLRLARA